MPQRALTAAGTRPKKVEEYPAKNTYNLGANYFKPRMCFQKPSKALNHFGDLGPSQASNTPREQHDANELQRCHRLLPNLAEKTQGKLSTGNAYPTLGSPCTVYLRYQMQFLTLLWPDFAKLQHLLWLRSTPRVTSHDTVSTKGSSCPRFSVSKKVAVASWPTAQWSSQIQELSIWGDMKN